MAEPRFYLTGSAMVALAVGVVFLGPALRQEVVGCGSALALWLTLANSVAVQERPSAKPA